MILRETENKDCKLFTPRVFEDERGYFYEGFNKTALKENLGIDFNLVQINQSMSTNGVLRGLHFQLPPFDQAKLVSVIEGEVIDVAVDLRVDSSFFGRTEKVMLTSENKNHFYIPRGFAHGFLVLSDYAKFMYGVDNFYSPEHDSGIIYSDKDLDIDWGTDLSEFIVSNKDAVLQKFKDFKSPF
ncbi:MAG: dTDP-4-dehydrorhamnose 3,5-epimerase [Cyclobacteriaceae bacterium]